MFLLIFEDGAIAKAETLSDAELDMCDDGYVDIINITPPEPKLYYKEEWHNIRSVDSELCRGN